MKNISSLIACFIICGVLIQHRMAHTGPGPGAPLKVTDWDNLGYYLYLPGIFIYQDLRDLKWLPEIDRKYAMTGGNLYQANKVENGNYVSKYLGGVAILQTPFFLAGHWVAQHYGYPPDGFSPPYQWAIAIAGLFYGILGLFVLRRLLLLYFKDVSVAISLLLLCLATNFIQYTAIDGGMSHVYIFPLYAFILFASREWHKNPRFTWAILIGYIIGLAAICRPTEAVMLFIPLLWNTHTRDAAKAKWAMVAQHKSHIAAMAVAGFAGILPQLLYWKYTTGSFVYDVGSAWHFLTPHLQVLFGWEKGWFIYTPVTLFFVLGLFFVKPFPFKKSAIWFCLLNIYIIISWADWRYGGSYSTRALMQSYPVFALPLTALVERVQLKKWQWGFYLVGAYLIAVNIFQHGQYSKTVLHFYDMNRKYYGRIYLDPDPTPLDMSLLDNGEVLNNERRYKKTFIEKLDKPQYIKASQAEGITNAPISTSSTDAWIRVDATISSWNGYWGSYLCASLKKGDSVKQARVRLFNPISIEGKPNRYQFFLSIPPYFRQSGLTLFMNKDGGFEGIVDSLQVRLLENSFYSSFSFSFLPFALPKAYI